MSDISSKVGGIAVTVVTSAIIGGVVWVADQETFLTGDKGEQRRSKLQQLKRQVAETPPKGDDDDSSAGDDDDSSAPPRRET